MARRHPFKLRNFIRYLQDQIRADKRDFVIYSVLRALVILTLVRAIMMGSLEEAALCVLSLVLFLLPALAERELHIEIPTVFEAIIYLFIFAAEILGEINHFYTLIPGWDTILHTLNGFLCAAVGFSLVDVLNNSVKGMSLSPVYLAVVAFCFSMTVGVMWEFIEFFVDQTFYLDMQKDFVVQKFGSVTLDPTGSQTSVVVGGITGTTIQCADGSTYAIEGGYLDLGIIDTMKDLFVNFVGAAVYCTFGGLYVAGSARGGFTSRFLIYRRGHEPLAEEMRQGDAPSVSSADNEGISTAATSEKDES
jgi:hypothetical protein